MSALQLTRGVLSAALVLLPTLTLSQPVIPQQQVLPPVDAGPSFGTAVAVSDAVLVVGAPGKFTVGSAYVYEWRGGQWVFTTELRPPELLTFDGFGTSVAVDGDTIVVGAPGDDTVRDAAGAVTQTISNKGAAYVFRRTASGWTQEARLDQFGVNGGGSAYLPGAAADDAFGTSVGVDGTLVAVGMPGYDNPSGQAVFQDSGAVMIHERITDTWLVTGGAASRAYEGSPYVGMRFGQSLAVGGGVIIASGLGSMFEPPAVRRIVRLPNATPSNWYAEVPVPMVFQNTSGPAVDGQGFRARFGTITNLLPAPSGVTVIEADAVRTVTDTGIVTTHQPLPSTFERYFVSSTAFAAESNRGELYRGDLSGALAFVAGGQFGSVDGTGAGAGFTNIQSVATDGQGGYYVGDGSRIRHVTAAGVVTTVAGGTFGQADGPSGVGQLTFPAALVFDAAAQRLYVLDGNRIRVMTTDGTLSTLAGGGSGDGTGPQAGFSSPRALTLVADGSLRLLDGGAVRRVSPSGDVQTLYGQLSAPARIVDGPASLARLGFPTHLLVLPNGTTYVSDSDTLRRIDPDGTVTTMAGAPFVEVPALIPISLAARRDGRVAVGLSQAPAPVRPTSPAGGVVWVSDLSRGFPTEVWPAMPPDGTLGLGANVAFSGDLLLAAQYSRDGTTGQPIVAMRFAGDRWQPAFDLAPGSGLSALASYGTSLAASDRFAVVGAPGPSLAAAGVVIAFDLDGLDSDGDGLPDRWEQRYGLDPAVTTGTDGPGGDPDGDGATNAAELAAQTHPRNVPGATRYFAEGARTSFFATEFAVANAGPTAANVLLRYAAPDGTVATTPVTVPARQRRTVTVPTSEVREFATRVESDAPVVVDRVMTWDVDRGYGSHGEHALEAPATTWYFAEGATHSGFDLFYLLYNPSLTTPAQVRVRYLRAVGAPLEKTYEVAPNQRFNIWVNLEEFAGARLLAAADVSARIEVVNAVPIIAERAMYRTLPGVAAGTPGALFGAGHESAGITAPSSSWFFAEGATNDFFDLFILIANPGDQPSTVRARYLLASGDTFTKDYVIGASSRFNIWVDQETFDGHTGTPLANVGAVSTTLEVVSGPAVVAERAMWWPGPTPATWVEAHNSPGATTTAARWVAAAGEATSGTGGADTYYLIANPGASTATVTVTLLLDDGTAELTRTYDVAANSRFSVDVRDQFPQAVGKRFSAVVTTAPTTPVVVEWALYRDALGQFWGAGANALATPVP